MKRTLEGDLQTYVALHKRIMAGGDDSWTLDRKHLLNALLDAVPISTFAIQCSIDKTEFTATMLVIEGQKYGNLGAVNVQKIMKLATKAGYGEGAHTKFDPEVRQAYAIDGAQIELKNSSLGSVLKSTKAFEELTGVNAYDKENIVLYKLHIYPPGGHFKAHVDTPHGPGHIASAILVLGSEFTGGDLVIEHRGEQQRVSGPSVFAAWYTDCTHWVEPVLTGHRVVLQYDVYNRLKLQESESSVSENEDDFFTSRSSVPRPLATPEYLKTLVQQVQATLHKHSQSDLALMLRHMYFANGGLAPELLKGSDNIMWQALSEASDLHLSLVPLVLRQMGEKEYFVGGLYGQGVDKRENHILFIPGEDHADKTLQVFSNPGAEHTGNEAMDPDKAYLGAALVCSLKQESVINEEK